MTDSIITELNEDGEWEVAIPDDEAGQEAALDTLANAMADHVQGAGEKAVPSDGGNQVEPGNSV